MLLLVWFGLVLFCWLCLFLPCCALCGLFGWLLCYLCLLCGLTGLIVLLRVILCVFMFALFVALLWLRFVVVLGWVVGFCFWVGFATFRIGLLMLGTRVWGLVVEISGVWGWWPYLPVVDLVVSWFRCFCW